MTYEIYAFAGKRGSGKSTASQVLVDEGFVDVKFADPLKNMMRAFYKTCGVSDFIIEQKLEGDLKEVPCAWLVGKTPRYAMQMLGTEWRDLIDTNLWSNIFTARIESGVVGDKIVCSDFRFPHEGVVLQKLGAHTYRIERADLEDDEASKHASESGIKDVPVGGVILNSGSVEDLQQLIRELVAVNEAVGEIDIDALAEMAEY